MDNLGTFLLGSIVGAVALGAVAWKFGDDTVSDEELDKIISDTDKSQKRLEEINQELEQLNKENDAIDTSSPDSMKALLKISKRQQKLLDEMVSQ